MRILFVGDIVGRPGRDAALRLIPVLRGTLRVDFVIVNAENSAGGLGITREIALALLADGADVITLGNHAWAKREVYSYLDEEPRILRPANYPEGAPGRGYGVYQCSGVAIGVIVLQGRTFMDPAENPFLAADYLLEELRDRVGIVFVDFHAEASSEKQAFGWYLDGRVTAIVGTHTHVQTADERILPRGTAYLTDAGMTGPVNSVIGMSLASVLPRFTTSLPSRFEVAEGPAMLNGVLVDADASTGRATAITRV